MAQPTAGYPAYQNPNYDGSKEPNWSQPDPNQYPAGQNQASGGIVYTAQPGGQPQTVVVVQQEQGPSTTGHTVLACVVTWCCCFCLGVAAWGVLVGARNSPDLEGKKKISLGLSIAGIVFGVGWIIAVAVVYTTYYTYSYRSSYYYG